MTEEQKQLMIKIAKDLEDLKKRVEQINEIYRVTTTTIATNAMSLQNEVRDLERSRTLHIGKFMTIESILNEKINI